ncbi:E3 ubiquitin-protein ligase RNF123-like isoform X2 [Daktulosphaira vitifoliae]|uniref:E3 ubiquitin-protein ligase RNF123-like isoform X2 n=1 Tax=Daktulosphaira vitifoliae TaxID=58002 RepID=UPI0021AA12AB|nr:E3 ubiquitin-protein ligase RNF123-like isoform X2 [Daktulosphaira vitifoliae]
MSSEDNELDFPLDGKIASKEIGQIFGKNSINELKKFSYSSDIFLNKENLITAIEELGKSAEFEEIIVRENASFNNVEYFDTKNSYGAVSFTLFDTIYCRSGLATIKANIGVNHGLYQYEVQLCSNGSMKIGWATKSCVFTDSSGVGETVDSYGFDGYRTEATHNSNISIYGKKWRVGNVIGCVLDFTNQTIEYFNNGQPLGKAFENVNVKDLTFYPTIGLTSEERISVNLGKKPFKFNVSGARPLIDTPVILMNYLKQLQPKIYNVVESSINLQLSTKDIKKLTNQSIVRNIIKTVLFKQFGTLMSIPYLIDYYVIECIESLYKKKPKDVIELLKIMWEYLPENKMIFILENILFYMSSEFKCIWRNGFDVSYQILILKLLIEFCSERKTRRHLIKKIFFDKVRFSYFLHIIAPSDDIFQIIVPDVYWSIENIAIIEDIKFKLLSALLTDKTKHNKTSYKNACARIQEVVNSIEEFQIIFLEKLLCDNDQTEMEVSSRVLFSRRFHNFIQENMMYWRSDPMLKLPGPVILSTIFRLAMVIQLIWRKELMEYKLVKIYPNIFYFDHLNFIGTERIGGTFPYLKTKYKTEINTKLLEFVNDHGNSSLSSILSEDDDIVEADPTANLMAILSRFVAITQDRDVEDNFIQSTNVFKRISSEYNNIFVDTRSVLSDIFNNIICLYSIAGHKQLVEYVSFKERLADLSVEYAVINYEIKSSKENKEENEENLKRVKHNLILTSRYMAWLLSMIFFDSKEQILSWMLMVVASTIKNCSEYEEELFRFLPEYYLDNLLGLTVMLPDYTNAIQQYEGIVTDKKWLAQLIGEIFLEHFEDIRIVHPKSKDIILQGITLYFTHPHSVQILESASDSSRLHAMHSIFKPLDQKIWAKTNIVLMLIWYGSGFGFRHTQPPHLENRRIPPQETIEDILFINMGKERPAAYVFQNDIKSIITSDKYLASNFLNNSLNHLNWAFSEFISLFQEVKDIEIHNETAQTAEIMSKLKMCSTCYALSVTLLRVIEMVITFDRSLVTNQEGSLERIAQVICQILYRVNFSTNTFQYILQSTLPFTECIHKFSILVSTIGVLLSMIQCEIDEDSKHIESSNTLLSDLFTKALISDQNFSINSLDFIILPPTEEDEPFSLKSYESYFTNEELLKVSDVYHHLVWYMNHQKSSISGINDEDICLLCYSNKKNVVIMPCKHQCCKLCINHHLLYSTVCFYCKGPIEMVVDYKDSSKVLHDFTSNIRTSE